MARTITDLVRNVRIAASLIPGYRPPSSGEDALSAREPLIVVPDKVLLLGTGGGAYVEFDFDRGGIGPGPGPFEPYEHLQPSAAATWTVNHNLGHLPVVAVLNAAGAQVLAAVEHVSSNQARVELDSPMAGRAICV